MKTYIITNTAKGTIALPIAGKEVKIEPGADVKVGLESYLKLKKHMRFVDYKEAKIIEIEEVEEAAAEQAPQGGAEE